MVQIISSVIYSLDTFFSSWDSCSKVNLMQGAICAVARLCPTLCNPMDCSPPGSSVHVILQARILDWVAMPSFRGSLPNPGIKPRSPALQVDSLPSEPPGKPNNIGVGSLSFLQWIFLTQESNWGLLHCRQISIS